MNVKNFSCILASASPRRHHLLSQLGIRFEVINPDVDESCFKGEDPLCYVKRMAITKMEEALSLVKVKPNKKTLIISADTIVVLDSNILGKPKNLKQSAEYISQLAAKKHQVMTCFCLCVLYNGYKKYQKIKVVKSQVWLRSLSKKEINNYTKSKEGFDKAGGYAIQGHLGMALIDKIKGSYTNIIGLPLNELKNEIEKAIFVVNT